MPELVHINPETHLKSDEFSSQERVVKLGKTRLENDSQVDHSNEFTFPEDFNLDDYIVIASPLGNRLGSRVMSRTSTDGRSVGEFVGQIKDKEGRYYCELLVKGVGVNRETTKVNSIRSSALKKEQKDSELLAEHVIQGKSTRKLPIRYSTDKIVGISDNYGFSSMKEIILEEDKTGQSLAEAGLRTRRLLFVGKFADEVPIATPQGIVSAKDVEERLGFKPGVEVWVMRSRYRVDDCLKHSLVDNTKLLEASGVLSVFGEGYSIAEKPYHVRAKEMLALSSENKEKINGDFEKLAKDILKRAKLDDDSRFVSLSTLFKNIGLSDKANLKEFWLSYLRIFSSVLGEQVGIMYQEGAFTKDKMLNAQNVTLMAEIVDHDVTYFFPQKKSDAFTVIEQFSQTIKTLCSFATQLFAFDLLEESINLEEILVLYATGIKRVLGNADKELLSTALKEYFFKEKPSMLSYSRYKTIVDEIEQYKDRPFMADVIRKRIESKVEFEQNIVWSPIENASGHWGLKKDYMGAANVPTVCEILMR